jgi:hypothetical protein
LNFTALSKELLSNSILLSINLEVWNHFANHVSPYILHRPYQGVLYFQNDVWHYRIRRHEILLRRIRKVP